MNMRIYLLILFTLLSVTAFCQQDSAGGNLSIPHAPYERHSTIATLSVGFIDQYRHDYTLPKGFEKSNTSGFAPIYGKLEYAVNKHLSIAATFAWDNFVYNYNQLDTGYNGVIKRYHTNQFRLYNAGVAAFYHLGSLIHIKHLDPFIGAGISLNNIHYSAFPQGDSVIARSTHTLTPYFKAGARYYITSKYSFYADAGYDQHSIFSLGFSCRFFARKDQ